MSRHVDDTRPYTDEEKEYLRTRANGESLITINDRRFAHLSEQEKAVLTGRALGDDAKEAKIEAELARQEAEAEANAYHPDDVAQVQNLTIKQLRERLETEGQRTTVTSEDKDPDDDDEDPFTEKEVLAYRLLNFLDRKRKVLSGELTADDEEEDDEEEDNTDGE